MRADRWLPLIVFVTAACFTEEGEGCGDDCANDFDCGTNEICVDMRGFDGTDCIFASSCSSDSDCRSDERCEQREGLPADHPFEEAIEGKQVCVCSFGDCEGPDGSSGPGPTSGPGAGGPGGSGASGGGGSGAQGGAAGGGPGGSGGAAGAAGQGGTGG